MWQIVLRDKRSHSHAQQRVLYILKYIYSFLRILKGGWSNVKYYPITNNLKPISIYKLFLTTSRDQPHPILSTNPSSRNAHWTESKPFAFVGLNSG